MTVSPVNGVTALNMNSALSQAGVSLGVLQNAGLMVADVIITTAQVKALNATPKVIVAAPGAGIALIPVMWVIFMDYATTQYAGIGAGEDLALRYTDGSGAIQAVIETTGFLDQASDQYRYTEMLASASGTSVTDRTPVANAALVMHMTAGEIITGDSPLAVRLLYRTVNLSTMVTS